MEERSKKTAEKSVRFEKSGEIISVCICLENISPYQKDKKTISDTLDLLFREAKEIIY